MIICFNKKKRYLFFFYMLDFQIILITVHSKATYKNLFIIGKILNKNIRPWSSQLKNAKRENAKITVPLPLQRYRDRASVTVADRYWPLRTVSHHYQALHALPNVTSVTCVTERYKRYQVLQSVTYFILQITLNGLFYN